MKKIIFICTGILSVPFLLHFTSFKSDSDKHGNVVVLSDKAPKPIGPYSQAIMNGNMLFLSGQISINPITNKLDTGSIENETRQVLENMKAVLSAAGLNTNNVVKTTIYLTDLAAFQKVNEIYAEYFKENPPARETIQVSALPKKVHIEISAIAIK